ncbi:MAG: hypothetical protein ACD_23C00329G0003 [uncultured bacterium]|nr:MAG: hypothetical protein ACD_23C00329G0003 [uncultured bacterium]
MNRKATAEDVAKEAGVSRWTVTRAYTEGSNISNKSRDLVLAVADRLGYRPNLLARSLNTKTTHQIAVLVDDFANPHKLTFLEKLTAALQSEGLMALLIHIGQKFDHANAFSNADQRQVDAIVLLGTGFKDESLLNWQKRGGPPVYVLARESTHEGIPSIACDAQKSMKEIVDHLAAKGYKRPGFMSGAKALSTALGRQKYFGKYWAKHGIKAIPELDAGAYDYRSAESALRKYLLQADAANRIDVLMCENDVLALGAFDVAQREFGLRIPEDIAIVGYDGNDLTAMSVFDITTYEQPTDAMIAALMDMLQGRGTPTSVTLPGRLIVRGST